jgi:hypothetical protein
MKTLIKSYLLTSVVIFSTYMVILLIIGILFK